MLSSLGGIIEQYDQTQILAFTLLAQIVVQNAKEVGLAQPSSPMGQ